MTIRILRAKESWRTGATGQERQPAPGVASLASHRNFINRTPAAACDRGGAREVVAKRLFSSFFSRQVPHLVSVQSRRVQFVFGVAMFHRLAF
jgi:hypothetical protein